MKLKLTALFIIFILTNISFSSGSEQTSSSRLVNILVTFQETNPFIPWQRLRPGKRTGYGVVVRDKVILTTETILRNGTLIEVTLPASGKKLRTRTMLTDPQANLALLALVDDAEALPKTEIQLAPSLSVEGKTSVFQMDSASALQECEGTVIQINVDSVSDASFRTLTYRLLTNPTINNEGAPVFHENRLAGLIVDHNRTQTQATMIPFPVIQKFLNDAANPPYKGFPSAGISWKSLVDPAKRKFFGLPDDDQGIQITAVIGAARKSPQILFPNDIILEIAGMKIDNLGFYRDADFGRILFPYLINGRHQADDKVSMKIVRDKNIIDVQVPLSVWDDSTALIPEDHLGQMNPYLVHGGFLIRELSGRYLRSHGGDWEARVGSRLAYYYETDRGNAEDAGARILVLTAVLPDTINMGYEQVRNEIVETINGSKVKNINEALKVIDEKGGLHSLRLKSFHIDFQLDPDKIESANRRILDSYRIPAIDSRQFESLLKQ